MLSRFAVAVAVCAINLTSPFLYAENCAKDLSTVTSYAELTRSVGDNMFYLETHHEGTEIGLVAFPNLIVGYSGETFKELGLHVGSIMQVTWDFNSRRVLSVNIGHQAYITRIANNNLIYARALTDSIGQSVVLTPNKIQKYGGENFSSFGIRNGAKFRVILDPYTSKVQAAFF